MNDNKTKFILWLTEFYNRFALRTPAFFQTLQTIGLICLGIGFLPDALDWLEITPAPIISKYISLAVKVAGAVTWIISKLPAQNATSVAKATDKLPFTETKE